MIAILPSCRLALGSFTSAPAPATTNLVQLRNPIVLKAVRQGIAARAKALHAPDAERHRAFKAALRELDAGRSVGVALSVGYGVLTGRDNALLRDHAPIPA